MSPSEALTTPAIDALSASLIVSLLSSRAVTCMVWPSKASILPRTRIVFSAAVVVAKPITSAAATGTVVRKLLQGIEGLLYNRDRTTNAPGSFQFQDLTPLCTTAVVQARPHGRPWSFWGFGGATSAGQDLRDRRRGGVAAKFSRP